MHVAVRRTVGRNGGAVCSLFFGSAANYCPTWRCCGTAARGGGTAPGPPQLQGLPDLFDQDETMTLSVYRPHSEGEQSLASATGRFLYTIITTADEQEWKDMLSAAIRCGTLRERHVRAVIRGVHQSQYNVDGVAGAGGGRGRARSTPATRLQRALDVVQVAVHEGYKVSPESVHALLVILLRALLSGPTGSFLNACGENSEGELSQLLTSRAVVWRFLAWMERHNYHVMSTAVLESLELIVDDDAPEKNSGEQKAGVRQNRLEYLQNEHNRLSTGAHAMQRRCAKGGDTPRATPCEKGRE